MNSTRLPGIIDYRNDFGNDACQLIPEDLFTVKNSIF